MQRPISSTPDSTGSSASASSSVNDSTPLWQYVTRVVERSESGGNTKFTCNFCRATFAGSYFRVKAHLRKAAGNGIKKCSKVTDEELARLQKLQDDAEARTKALVPKQVPLPSSSSMRQDGDNPSIPTGARGNKRRSMSEIEKIYDVANINAIDEGIARAFFTSGSPFNLAKNPHFIRSYQILSDSGIKGYKPPPYNKIRTTLLDRERVHLDGLFGALKSTWNQKGVSIVCDGWTDMQRRPLINFIAITDGGPMFLKAINCQGEVKDKFFISTIIKDVIEEVGPQNVVQVITDNAPICKAADIDKPCLHLVYEMWDTMIDKVKAAIYKEEGKREDEASSFFDVVCKILTDRWAKSNTPLHCLAHSLNPMYYSPKLLQEHQNRLPPHMDNDISKMRNQYLRKLFPNPEQRRCVLDEFARFSICGGGFDKHDSISDRDGIEAMHWWVIYGGATLNLQALALKLLGQPSSSSCC